MASTFFEKPSQISNRRRGSLLIAQRPSQVPGIVAGAPVDPRKTLKAGDNFNMEIH